MILGIVLIAEIMDLLDSTVITIAAPTVRAELGGGTATMQWWAAGYTLAFGVFMIVGGRLGDVFGRRRVFLIGIGGFTLASAACALAPSPGFLIATRVLQGAFGALLIPQGLGVIKAVFPPREMGGAFAAFGPVMGLAAIAGPILAGWLVSADLLGTGWRMIFLINVPLGVIGLLGALRFMPESRSPLRIRLDPLGVVLVAAASLCLIYPLVEGRELGWPLWMFGLMAVGFVLLAAFAAVERRSGGLRADRAEPAAQPRFTSASPSASCSSPASPGCCWSLAVPAARAALLARARRPHARADVAGHGDHRGRLLRADAALRARRAAGRDARRRRRRSSAWRRSWRKRARPDELGACPALLVFGLGIGFVFGPLFNVILAGVDETRSARRRARSTRSSSWATRSASRCWRRSSSRSSTPATVRRRR